jgi:EAL domain-containing protein (putative c-di-GMP-specific phosphodiesterase class I)
MNEAVVSIDPKLSANVLSALKQLGVGVILDDFGAGNCSLSGLRLFSVEALKIDHSLISGMLADRETSEMVELIMLVAHKLKLKVIAEGIEKAKHWDRLCELECDFGQGPFFSCPVQPDAAGKLLRERSQVMLASSAAM